MYDLYVVCIISWNPEVVNLYNCCFKTDRFQIEIEIHFVRTRPDNTDSLRKSANKLKTEQFTSVVFQFSPTRIFQQKSPFRESVTYVFSGCHYVFTIFFSTPEKHIKLFLDKEIPRCMMNSRSHMLLEFSKNSVRKLIGMKFFAIL